MFEARRYLFLSAVLAVGIDTFKYEYSHNVILITGRVTGRLDMVTSHRAGNIRLLPTRAATPMARDPGPLPTHILRSAERASDGPVSQARDSPVQEASPRWTIGFEPRHISESTAPWQTKPTERIGFGLPARNQDETSAGGQPSLDVPAPVPVARETARAPGEIRTVTASEVFQEVIGKAKGNTDANGDFWIRGNDLPRFVDALYLLNWFVDNSPSDEELAREAQKLLENTHDQRKTDGAMCISPVGLMAIDGIIPLVKNAESTISWNVGPLNLPNDITNIAATNPTEVLSYIAGSYCSARDFGDPILLGEEGSRALTTALDSIEKTLGNDLLSERLRETISNLLENEPALILTRNFVLDLRTLGSLAAGVARQDAHAEETSMTGRQALGILSDIVAKERSTSGGVGPLGEEMLQLKAALDWITGEIKAGYRLRDSSDQRIVDDVLGVFRSYPFEPGGHLGQAGLALLDSLVPVVERMVGVSAAGAVSLGPAEAVDQQYGPGPNVVSQKASEVLGRILQKLSEGVDGNGDSHVLLGEDAQVLVDVLNYIKDRIEGSCLTKAERRELRDILSWDYEGKKTAKNALTENFTLSRFGLDEFRKIIRLAERMESGERLVDADSSRRGGRKKIATYVIIIGFLAAVASGIGIYVLNNLNLDKKDKPAHHETVKSGQVELKKLGDSIGVLNDVVDRRDRTIREQQRTIDGLRSELSGAQAKAAREVGQAVATPGQTTGGTNAQQTGQTASSQTGGTKVTAGQGKAQHAEVKGMSVRGQLAGMGVSASTATESNAGVYSGYLSWVPISETGKTVVNLECSATLGPKSTGKVVHVFPALVPSGNLSNLGEGKRDLSNPDLIPLGKKCIVIADYGGLRVKTANDDEKTNPGTGKPYVQDKQLFKISVVYEGSSYSMYAGSSEGSMELVATGTYTRKTENGKGYAPLLIGAAWKGQTGRSRDITLDVSGGEVLW